MKMKSILLTLFAFTFMVSCGGEKAVTSQSSMPNWIMVPPNDTEEYFYAPGQAESSRQGTALRMAQSNATTAMAQKLEVKVSALQKSFEEEVQSGPNANYAATFSSASEQLVNNTMNGVTRDRAECEQLNPEVTGGNVNQRCYVLVRMPVGQARSVLENALSKDEELYTKFKASKAFEELQNKLHELED
ncbi:LPP20 family lipoprotein [Gracilimonas sediminicola]|uniref:LPP20 family lipoprotein n=2 Tax=Gracilimonas TaxID=649462 RepID=UPI0038D3E977